MSTEIINSDIMEWAKTYKGPKSHALLCDPPYHLGFMNKAWDQAGPDAIAFNPATWAAIGEHLLPGGFGMAFAASRGWHRMAVAIEDAGFIIHPSVFMLRIPQSVPSKNRHRHRHRHL